MIKNYYSNPKNIIGNFLLIAGVVLQVLTMAGTFGIKDPCNVSASGAGFSISSIPFSYILIGIGLFLSDSDIRSYFNKNQEPKAQP